MHRFAKLIAVVFVFMCQLAQAAPNGPPVSGFVGNYYLTGNTEIGSQLQLTKSGRFSWILMYGAEDLFAEGTWKAKGDRVELTPAPGKPGKFRIFNESEIQLRKGPAYGTWVAIVGVPMQGPIGGIEVRFESKAGRSATTVSEPNGDAIVIMPSSEEWTRAALRRAGSQDPWTWIDIPETRSLARIAAFAVTNPGDVRPSPFKTLTLSRSGNDLKIEDSGLGLRGVYQRQAPSSRKAE